MGSILPLEYSSEGANFLSDAAWHHYKERRKLGWGVEPYRCERYLTSSQALTFNLFAPLADDLSWFDRTLEELGIPYEGLSRRMHMEFQPQFRGEGHLDKTVADAFVESENGGLVIETKLADQFSRRRISDRALDFYSWINKEIPIWRDVDTGFAHGAQEQLARVHALGTLASRGSSVLLFLHHPLDTLSCSKAETYRDLLHRPDEFRVVGLDRFADALLSTAQSREHRRYVANFRTRYLDLCLSDEVFNAMERARSVRS